MPGPMGGTTTSVVMPGIKTGAIGMPISVKAAAKLVRAVVDTHLHLPDMFELTFFDPDGTIVDDAGLSIGTKVQITGSKAGSSSSTTLIKGEVTSIEAICSEVQILSVVRGYEKAHR